MGTAKLHGYQCIINTHGVATVVPKASSRVYGVLWSITEVDEQALDEDEYEEVDRGAYYKVTVEVETDAKGSVQALTYVASNNIPGPPMPGYLEDIVVAAKQHGLPGEYVEELKPWQGSF